METLAVHARADVLVTLAHEAGRAAFGGTGEAVHVLQGLATTPRGAAGARRALRAGLPGGAAPPRARALRLGRRPGRPRGRGGRRRRPAAGRRRARRARARGRARRGAARRRGRAGGGRRRRALAGRGGRARRAGLRRGGRPGRRRPPPARGPHGSRSRGGGARPRGAGRRLGRRPPGLAARTRPPRRPGAGGPPRGARCAAPASPDAAGARALWEAAHPTFPLAALDRVREAAGRGPRALRDRLGAEALRLLSAPHRGEAAILAGGRDARRPRRRRPAARAWTSSSPSPHTTPRSGRRRRRWPTHWRRSRSPRRTGRCPARSPSRARSRSGRAACARLVVARLQEGTFPAPPRPEPFLGDADRRALNAASGLRLRLHEDALDRERALFYAAVSRPTERLALSWHVADDDGAPRVPSLLLSDVRDLFAPSLWERRRRRALGAVERAGGGRPGPSARSARSRAPRSWPRSPRARRVSASGAGGVGGLPRRWFVERFLRPGALEADPEPLRQGGLAHDVLEEVLRTVSAGGAPDAGAAARGPRGPRARAGPPRRPPALAEPRPARARSCAGSSPTCGASSSATPTTAAATCPTHFELTFGGEGDDHPAVELAGGELVLRGRVDRVDLSPGRPPGPRHRLQGPQRRRAPGALARRPPPAGRPVPPGPRPAARRRAAGRPLPAAGRQGHRAARAAARRRRRRPDGEAPGPRRRRGLRGACWPTSRRRRSQAAAELRAGRLEGRPATCAYRGGCAHPSICRCEAA